MLKTMDNVTSQKRAEITDRLAKRDEERLNELEKRKQERGNDLSTLEGAKYFLENFNKERCDILNSLEKIDNLSKDERLNEFDKISQKLQSLQKFHADSTMFLPSYDVRQSQEALGVLQTRVQEKRDELFPKKKFAFSSKKKLSSKVETEPVPSIVDNSVDIRLSECSIQKRSHECIEMSENTVFKEDVSLIDNNFCTIKVFGAPSTVHMKNLENCIILVGPVSSSVFISDCKKCTFVIACQQLRTHSTVDSKFFLHVTSRAIIEDCEQLRFAPYSLSYPNLDKHFVTAGLDKSKNNWNDVDDFNWLACDVHSPNWSVMKEEEREEFKF